MHTQTHTHTRREKLTEDENGKTAKKIAGWLLLLLLLLPAGTTLRPRLDTRKEKKTNENGKISTEEEKKGARKIDFESLNNTQSEWLNNNTHGTRLENELNHGLCAGGILYSQGRGGMPEQHREETPPTTTTRLSQHKKHRNGGCSPSGREEKLSGSKIEKREREREKSGKQFEERGKGKLLLAVAWKTYVWKRVEFYFLC